jgi:hypothetical protein
MCGEILRIMKPGATFVGSFNLGEPPTPKEPQQLGEGMIRRCLLDSMEIESYRATRWGPADDPYAPFFSGLLPFTPGQKGCLWVKARKHIRACASA